MIAPATVPGDGARAILRLSGEGLATLLDGMLEAVAPASFAASGPPRCVRAVLGPELAAVWGALEIDVLWWPGPAGPTGGPLAELQVPASGPLVDALVAAACRRGARLARPGEFSLRAFLAGRLDLLQAEAVLAVVDARTPAELSRALDRMAGGVGRPLLRLRETILDLRADLEAVIDFSDEASPDHAATGDAVFWDHVAGRLAAVIRSLDEVGGQLAGRDAAARELPRAVLVGRPNIGKSSLFNALAGADVALVADEDGTTRDWVGARLEEDGTACLLVDLAGIDGPGGADPARAAAAAVATRELARADVVLVCRDATACDEVPVVVATGGRIDVLTRCDRCPAPPSAGPAIATSSRDGRGIGELRSAVLRAVAELPGPQVAVTLRMRVGIEAARDAIGAARAAAAGPAPDEAVVAGHLGRALDAVDDVTGSRMDADLLDRIFQRHCIGK